MVGRLLVLAVALTLAVGAEVVQPAEWDRALQVRLVRARVGEAVARVLMGGRLRVDYPEPIGPRGWITLGGETRTVGQALAAIATQAGLRLEVAQGQVWFWLPAEDGRLAALVGLTGSGDADLRIAGCADLGTLGDPRALPPLLAAACAPEHAVASAARRALRPWRACLRQATVPSGFIPALIAECGRLPPDSPERNDLIDLIDAVGSPQAEAAILAEHRLGHTRRLPRVAAGAVTVDLVCASLGGDIRQALWESCDHLPDALVLPRLRPLVARIPPEQRGLAIDRLLAGGDPALIAQMARRARSAQPLERAQACALLAKGSTADAVATVEPLIADPDPGVREAAAWSLVAMGRVDPAVPVLLGLLDGGTQESDWRRRARVLTALKAAAPNLALIAALAARLDHDPSDTIGADVKAHDALGGLRADAATDVLLARLATRGAADAARGLVQARDPRSLTALLVAARDTVTPYLAATAGEALAALPLDDAGRRELAAAFPGLAAGARYVVLRAIALDRAPDLTLVVEGQLCAAETEVRVAAVEAASGRCPSLRAGLIEMLADPVDRVRATAVAALAPRPDAALRAAFAACRRLGGVQTVRALDVWDGTASSPFHTAP